MEIKVPAVGESVTEATIGEWMKQTGDYVQRDEILLSIETDKASVEVVAEDSGVLEIKVEEGKTVEIGAVIGVLDPSAKAPEAGVSEKIKEEGTTVDGRLRSPEPEAKVSKKVEKGDLKPASTHEAPMGPAVRKMLAQKEMSPSGIKATGPRGRITKEDVMRASNEVSSGLEPGGVDRISHGPTNDSGSLGLGKPAEVSGDSKAQDKRSLDVQKKAGDSSKAGSIERVKMNNIRKRIAQRLVQAQQTAAILTTFNEVDMSKLMNIRSEYKEVFETRHGTRLGFMGFFVKASIEALKQFPAVNASIDGEDILYKNFFNIGVAVSSPKGLVVPVLKNADQMSLAELEKTIVHYATKAREGTLGIDDMSDGTFTISNGGVFGSLMSTPILNPPQSGILGMHKIEKRPVVVGDEIQIRPMMYLALSYDHRMIDGKESVGFLVKIKENIEDPYRLLLHV